MSRKLFFALAIVLVAVSMLPAETAHAIPPTPLSKGGPGSAPLSKGGLRGDSAGTAMRPLAEMLNPDGSLNLDTGYSGALDPKGWRMEYTPDGAPLFAPAAADTWYGVAGGLNSSVYAIALVGNNVYVGGSFTNAGSNPNADYIARWTSNYPVLLPIISR